VSVDFAQVIRERQTHLGLSLPRLFRKELEATKPRRRREGIEKEREREKRGREEEEENSTERAPIRPNGFSVRHRPPSDSIQPAAAGPHPTPHSTFLTNRAVSIFK
jgi:hypothetical protein